MSDKRLIVLTGASRGLGMAMTEQFTKAGHTVAGCSRSPEAVIELLHRFGVPNTFEVVDVAREEQVAAWATSVLSEMGPPDLLINNAAMINENAPLWEVPPDEFSQLVDTNIKGVYFVIRHFLPAMIERGSGVIVNFSSGWGRSVSADVAPYCASKWAIEGLTRALADELPSGLAAIPLNPGVIHTAMLESCFGASASHYPSPEQWASSAVPFMLNLNAEHNGSPLTAPN